MHRTLALLVIGFVTPALAVGQQNPPHIAKEDIFDRLAPLVESTVKPAPAASQPIPEREAPEVIITDAADRSEEPAIDASAPPIGAAQRHAPPPAATELTPRVRRLLNPNQTQGPSDGQPQVVDEAHIVETQGELARLSPDELRQLIIVSAELLSQELEDVHYGERWRKFLRLPEVSAEFAAASQPAPGARLQLILANYSKIARDKQYQVITDHYAFHLLHHGLAEYLSSEQERGERRSAYDDVGKLLQALAPVPTGAMWREYFALDRAARLLTSPQPLSRDEVGQLQLILARFEQAAVDDRYRAVAKLPGFAATHRRLQIAVAVIPDAEADSFTQTELPGQPVPNDQPATVHLISQAGVTFHRSKEADGWQPADGAVALKSGDSVRTDERGVARLAIGGDYQALCMPGTLLHVSQFIDDDGRLVTQLHSEQGDFKISGGAEADVAVTSTGQRIIIARGEHKIAAGDGLLELDFQHDPRGNRMIAAVYVGSVQVRHKRTGDQVVIRAGREAVMLQAGIAVRAAAEKPDAWWPSRRVQTAAEPGNQFTR